MSLAIEDLRHEHEAVLMALDILEALALAVGRETRSQADVAAFLQFLQEFVDKCHHGKEEGLLFPAMIAAGIPEQGGPVAVMLAEHEQGRALVRAMCEASEPSLDAEHFAQAASAYAEHLRAHIAKENGVLFPMAEQVLPPEVLDRLRDEFADHEETVIGHGRHEELHAMLKALKEKYLG